MEDSYITYIRLAERLIAEGKSRDEVKRGLMAHWRSEAMADSLLSSLMPQPQPQTHNTAATATPQPAAAPAPPAAVMSTPAQLAQSAPVSQRRPRPLGWLIVIAMCLLPSLVVLFSASAAQRFGNLSNTLVTLGNVTGVIGLVLYAVNMFLATRLSWIEDLFGGLNKVYMAHHIMGGLALVMILVHPLLLAGEAFLGRGLPGAAGFFIPSVEYIGSAYGIFALAAIILLLVFTFYIKLPYRIWLTVHKFLAVTFLLIGLHVLFTPNSITHNAFLRWYLIGLVALGLFAFVYRTLLPNVFVKRHVYTISAAVPKSIGVVEVTLKPTDKVVNFTAGQFVFISFGLEGLSAGREWHPFTVASAPSDGSLNVVIKSLGTYTEAITRILPSMVGMTAIIEGAYGRFSYRNFDNPNQVWIAGGIGITPFLSMAAALGDEPHNIDLYYSVNSESELIDLDQLRVAQANLPNHSFRVFPYVSEKYQRFLGVDMITATSGDLQGRDFLLCGPPAMMRGLQEQLMKAGVPKQRIHTEEFSIS